jgi:hypothetical protein
MWLSKNDIGWDDIDVPLCETCAEQNEQVNDIREAEGQTREEHQEYSHALVNEVFGVDFTLCLPHAIQGLSNVCLHYNLFEKQNIRKACVAGEVNGEPAEHQVQDHQTHVE